MVIGGIVITGGLFFAIFRELFASDTPTGVFNDAFERCRKHDRVRGVLGEPIKGFGEMNSRGRRRYAA